MKANQTSVFSRNEWLYSVSRLFERSFSSGFRNLFAVNLTYGSLFVFDISLYHFYVFGVLFFSVIGAIFGDLIIGNKKALKIGAILNVIGVLLFVFEDALTPYPGLFLTVIGSGFYTPNLLSGFGKGFYQKKDKLDSGFTFLYLSELIGAVIGFFVLGSLVDTADKTTGGMMLCLFTLLALVPLFILRKRKNNPSSYKMSLNYTVPAIVISTIAIMFLWLTSELNFVRIYLIKDILSSEDNFFFNREMRGSWGYIFTMIFCVISGCVWIYVKQKPYFKLVLGFFAAIIAMLFLNSIPDYDQNNYMLRFLFFLIFFSLAEALITPICYSIVSRYSNEKYMAISFSLFFAVAQSMMLFLYEITEALSLEPQTKSGIGFGIIIIGFVAVLIFFLVTLSLDPSKRKSPFDPKPDLSDK